jgi:hypothetical protein
MGLLQVTSHEGSSSRVETWPAGAARWFFWLVPLWLLVMLPEADHWERSRWRRLPAAVLLAISIGSASYALVNPWRESWLLSLLAELGLVSY